MRYAVLALALLLTSVVYAEPRSVELPLSVEDQSNLTEVCRAAMQNTNLATSLVYSISAWCLTKQQQVKQLLDKSTEKKDEAGRN